MAYINLEHFRKTKKFNIVELGPGDGSLTKILLKTFQKFPLFNKSTNIFLYEKSNLLKKLQKKNINNLKVKWIKNFNNIKKGPIIFLVMSFLMQYQLNNFLEKKSFIRKILFFNKKNKIDEVYKKAFKKRCFEIKKFKVLKNLKFIEFPKLGLL